MSMGTENNDIIKSFTNILQIYDKLIKLQNNDWINKNKCVKIICIKTKEKKGKTEWKSS